MSCQLGFISFLYMHTDACMYFFDMYVHLLQTYTYGQTYTPHKYFEKVSIYIHMYTFDCMCTQCDVQSLQQWSSEQWPVKDMTSGKSPKISLPGMSPQHQLCIAWAQQIKCPRDPQNMRTVSGGNKKVNSEQWSKQETVHITAAPFHQKMFHWCFSQTMVHTQRWEKW